MVSIATTAHALRGRARAFALLGVALLALAALVAPGAALAAGEGN